MSWCLTLKRGQQGKKKIPMDCDCRREEAEGVEATCKATLIISEALNMIQGGCDEAAKVSCSRS